MGFLSKLMKNPLVQTALPFALSAAMGSPWAMKMGKWGMFDKMSPLMANALKQSALGFGTAALSGSKRPWKGAMYAGLTSIPFSYMSAANAANAFNEEYAGAVEPQRFLKSTTPKVDPWWEYTGAGPGGLEQQLGIGSPGSSAIYHPGSPAIPNYQFRNVPVEIPKLKAWDIATGRQDALKDIVSPATADQYYSASKAAGGEGYTRTLAPPGSEGKYMYTKLTEGKPMELPDADIFTKDVPIEGAPGYYDTKSDWLPTAVSQAAALYGGRDTPEEEWEQAQRKRKKELAWMYGVDEDQIEGEMNNPWYTGGMFNSGGIASLDKSYGGDVNGPGTGTSDSIDAKLSDGEFVMTAKAVENLGGGDRYEGARKMYSMMNMLDPHSETMSEVI